MQTRRERRGPSERLWQPSSTKVPSSRAPYARRAQAVIAPANTALACLGARHRVRYDLGRRCMGRAAVCHSPTCLWAALRCATQSRQTRHRLSKFAKRRATTTPGRFRGPRTERDSDIIEGSTASLPGAPFLVIPRIGDTCGRLSPRKSLFGEVKNLCRAGGRATRREACG